ncbi:hypothetical protein KP509_22G073700 [Ceratopteris richardii]|nr:hypothetical protein KP509_22G073700 [Ceratopteris richardii]
MAAQARLRARLHPDSPILTTSHRVSVYASSRLEGSVTCTNSRKCRSSNVNTNVSCRSTVEPNVKERSSKQSTGSKTLNELGRDCFSDVCSICLESFLTQKVFICHPCKHKFHDKCLTTWLETSFQCPNCRTSIAKLGFYRASIDYFNLFFRKMPHKSRPRTFAN